MVWRIKNRHTFKVCRFKNRQYSKSMPILNSAYFTAWYDDMTSAFGKVCRIKNRHTFKSMPILNSAYFTECRFVIRHITQTETQTETELLRRHPWTYLPHSAHTYPTLQIPTPGHTHPLDIIHLQTYQPPLHIPAPGKDMGPEIPPYGQTDTCEKHYLPATSFADGKLEF